MDEQNMTGMNPGDQGAPMQPAPRAFPAGSGNPAPGQEGWNQTGLGQNGPAWTGSNGAAYGNPNGNSIPKWTPPPKRVFPVDGADRVFALETILCAVGAANGLYRGGVNAAFAIFMVLFMGFALRYMVKTGSAGADKYGMTISVLAGVVALSFLRNSDGGLKFLLFVLVVGAFPLGLTILAGKNQRDPGEITTILDSIRTIFVRGFGDSGVAMSSLVKARSENSTRKARFWNVMKGLLIAVPVLLILLPLLASADEAFAQVLRMLPDIELDGVIFSLILGGIAFLPLFGMGMSLRHEPKAVNAEKSSGGILASATVNTVLICVCVVYVVYLVSQLAYFFSGFLGLLPAGYTAAAYARRGFFEMAAICAVNLGIIALAAWLVRKEEGISGLTRGLCVFISGVTLFLVGSAFSKMFIYIGSYGLTYKRVLTSLFMLWLALAVILAAMNLFRKLPYMRILVVAALCIAALVSWAGLDTVVAKYNVEQYLAGNLDAVDVDYLDDLDDAGIPYLAELLDSSDETVAWEARETLYYIAKWEYGCADRNGQLTWYRDSQTDIRGWNATSARAWSVMRDLVASGRLK